MSIASHIRRFSFKRSSISLRIKISAELTLRCKVCTRSSWSPVELFPRPEPKRSCARYSANCSLVSSRTERSTANLSSVSFSCSCSPWRSRAPRSTARRSSTNRSCWSMAFFCSDRLPLKPRSKASLARFSPSIISWTRSCCRSLIFRSKSNCSRKSSTCLASAKVPGGGGDGWRRLVLSSRKPVSKRSRRPASRRETRSSSACWSARRASCSAATSPLRCS
mmetsp:Transcript_23675/g.59071  ORF Transcript_23675/g.59071 Transcript_23675/m.59071 type:complete len:222 (-) Transcript_23675:2343-3008(-)